MNKKVRKIKKILIDDKQEKIKEIEEELKCDNKYNPFHIQIVDIILIL